MSKLSKFNSTQGAYIKPRRTLGGFSIVEALITVLILSTGLIALAKFNGTITQDSAHAKNRTEAANFAQAKLEELRNYQTLTDFDAIADGADVPSTGMVGLNQTFTRSWTVKTDANSKTVTMQVSWPDKNGVLFSSDQDYTVELVSIIARIDPARPALSPLASGTTTTMAPVTTTTTTTLAPDTTTTTTSTSSTSTTVPSSPTTTTSTSTTITTSTTTTTTTTIISCHCKNGAPIGSNPAACGGPNYCPTTSGSPASYSCNGTLCF